MNFSPLAAALKNPRLRRLQQNPNQKAAQLNKVQQFIKYLYYIFGVDHEIADRLNRTLECADCYLAVGNTCKEMLLLDYS